MSHQNNGEWIDRFLSGELDESQQELFLERIRSDHDYGLNIWKNLLADFWLSELFRVRHSWNEANLSDSPIQDTKVDLGDTEFRELMTANSAITSVGYCSEMPVSTEPAEKLLLFYPSITKDIFETINESSSDVLITVPCLIKEEKKPRWRPPLRVYVTTTLLLIMVLAIIFMPRNYHKEISPDSEFARGVVKIEETIDVEWGNNISYARGEVIGPNELIFSKGIVKLRYESGTELIVEGPARCVINSNNTLFCSQGQISGKVTKRGQGFQIVTPYGNLVDRGTEFFISVNDKDIEVSLIKGKVEMISNDRKTTRLKVGQSWRSSKEQPGKTVKQISKNYYTMERFITRLSEYVFKEKTAKKERDIQLDTKLNLLARYDLSDTSTKKLPNYAQYGQKLCSELQLTSVVADNGRLSGLNAYKFASDDSAGSFHLDGQYAAMTVVVSVRMDKLMNQGNVLLSSNDYAEKPGSFMWQISKSGHLTLSITKDVNQYDRFDAVLPFETQKLGTWCEFKFVVDGNKKLVTQYINGVQTARNVWERPIPLVPGSMTVGNMKSRKQSFNQRFFGGVIDEIIMYDIPQYNH